MPEPGPGQVRIRVKCAGVSPTDPKIRRGDVQADPDHRIRPGDLGQDAGQFAVSGQDIVGPLETRFDGGGGGHRVGHRQPGGQ